MTLYSLAPSVTDLLRRMVELEILAPENVHTAETAIHASFGPLFTETVAKVPPPPSLPDCALLTPPPPPQELAANTHYGEHCAKLNTTLNDVKAQYLKEKSTYEATLAAEKLRFLNMRKHWAGRPECRHQGGLSPSRQLQSPYHV